jgi:hypothetical protein
MMYQVIPIFVLIAVVVGVTYLNQTMDLRADTTIMLLSLGFAVFSLTYLWVSRRYKGI